jgi:hypothetical protein
MFAQSLRSWMVSTVIDMDGIPIIEYLCLAIHTAGQ